MTTKTTFEPKPFSWIRAEFPFGITGNYISAFYIGKNEKGEFLVEFSDDSNARPVKNILPPLTQEELDDELELKTGCRFGKLDTCKSPDCKHNGFIDFH